ncbi:hypothetical protein EJ02DRAFT_162711 [Clathrospora elynae]|uniref:Uncharacterized protein n=1 Tax=Clathrospora elynae TaxID=706981 RepID=A0A6A5SSF7_9PLEO|nr:hypothetical protein EJ02DRAFT_162711 [Clathrospora elynae]
MRFSIVSVAIMASVAVASPQYSIQPISQISDGQIQAPPATAVPAPSEVPSVVPSPSASAPEASAPEATAPAATPTPVAPTATPVAPVPTMMTPIVPGFNSTSPSSTGAVSVSMSPSESAGSSESATTPASGSATSSGSVPEASVGAATGNMVSFGGLVLAIGAVVFA